jgi:transcriptional regulator with XRE-family HTH domain
MKLGVEIRKAREAMKLTQEKYAARLGMYQQRISELENDASVGTKTLERLLKRGGLRWTDKGPRAA